jgi:archaellum biogenesis protein FlaJ (TadC family)
MVVIVMVVMLVMLVMVVLMMVVMLMMVMLAAALLLAVDKDSHVRTRYPAFLRSLPLKLHARQPKRIQPFHKALRIRHQLLKCRREHIPGGSHITVQI